jgi:hypothetical protein
VALRIQNRIQAALIEKNHQQRLLDAANVDFMPGQW